MREDAARCSWLILRLKLTDSFAGLCGPQAKEMSAIIMRYRRDRGCVAEDPALGSPE